MLDDLVKAGKVRALGASAMYGYQFYNMQEIALAWHWAKGVASPSSFNHINAKKPSCCWTFSTG